MTAPELDTVRYARHLLLPEIGRAGQERLLSASVRPSDDVDAGALAVARDYLLRAGVRVGERGESDEPSTLFVPTEHEVLALAGTPELLVAARALAGALGAVEAIKGVLGLGEPHTLQHLSLSSEEA